jgi:YgiT-type zinc finger domain-containing protein
LLARLGRDRIARVKDRAGVTAMKCEFCNAETTLKKVRKQHWFQGKLYIVENVDAEVCRECGERYFHAATLDRIDRIIASDHPVKSLLSVEVLSA